jgi:hypothetical protein
LEPRHDFSNSRRNCDGPTRAGSAPAKEDVDEPSDVRTRRGHVARHRRKREYRTTIYANRMRESDRARPKRVTANYLRKYTMGSGEGTPRFPHRGFTRQRRSPVTTISVSGLPQPGKDEPPTPYRERQSRSRDRALRPVASAAERVG